MTLIKSAPIGPAFAASHLEIVLVILVSVLFLGESLNMVQALGCLVIVAGVLVSEPSEAVNWKLAGPLTFAFGVKVNPPVFALNAVTMPPVAEPGTSANVRPQ